MKKHIFIVDDDEAILDVIKIILEDNGYKTTIVTEGNNFFKKINSQVPDLILLDIWLTGIDGLEITKKLKSSRKYSRVPVVMVSANNRGRQLALNSGADGFLAKPFEIDELIKTVKKFTNSKSRE